MREWVPNSPNRVGSFQREGARMSKRARKRRDRGKKKANHGKKPNT
nr:hypothetical protein [Pseudonocardia sediminis]